MTICLDANVFVRCLAFEPGSVEAMTWLRSQAEEEIVGPPFLPVEFGTAILRKATAGNMTPTQCAEALDLFGRFGIRYVWDQGLLQTAFNFAMTLGQHTIYDTGYLAVAEREKCELWTFDRRFAEAASRRHPRVRLLG